MGFLHPELLLVLVPAGVAWWFVRGRTAPTAVVRAIVLVLLVCALAGPYSNTARKGRDVVIVADRSKSMPAESRDTALEIARLAEELRREGDRVAVVTFGAGAAIESLPSETTRLARFERLLDDDGSDIAAALETALELVPADRPGSILLVSDGESNGADPVPIARRAAARGVRIDVRACPRPGTSDLSVERVELPDSVNVLEPFQFGVWVRADRRVTSSFELERDGRVLSSGTRVFEPGLNRIVLRDMVDAAGIAAYRVRVGSAEDRFPENNTALGATKVEGPRSILVLNDDGNEDTLVRVLRAARIPVKVARPEAARLDRIALTAHRAIVLENIAASRLGTSMRAIAEFVADGGGGLLVTGGKSSFGTGGYFKSPLDAALPVSMEMRQEHRKQGIALSVTMDRSGSMAAPVAGGGTKMDLANLGAVAAIELMSPMDSISVIAVDSSAHVIQSQTPVANVPELTSVVRRIQSQGGGIFTYTALLAAAEQLAGAPQTTRHIILFADAADAEEPGEYVRLLSDLEKAAVTTSVIALGTESDSDADFLKDVAARGMGSIYFTTDPTELPRLFAQDTLTVSRATFIEERTGCDMTPNLFGLAEIAERDFSDVDGYNLTYLKPGAVAGVVTRDEYRAPVFAFQQHGLGRSAAFTSQIGGSFGQTLVGWSGFASFFVSVSRWLVGLEEPEEVFATVRREGGSAVVDVEIDPERATSIDPSRMTLRVREADGTARDLTLERTGQNRFSARTSLTRDGIQLGTLSLGDGRTLELPPIALPYSPEFERGQDLRRGERVLREIAVESGGLVDPSIKDLFRGERQGRGWKLLGAWFTLLALGLAVVEIAARRLDLWSSVHLPAWSRRPARATAAPSAPGAAEVATPASATPPVSAPAPPAQPTIASALEQARKAAGRKLGR
ncbi:MAG: VWA domain-containing protein [Planctomycetes bacterium]|nr:VWA domain-containing protein [Planctomycetota bacterium]